MEKFGNVDLVIADVDDAKGVVRSFLPVELQAVDITGSYYPAYAALIENRAVEGRCSYGFNWGNVRKRFMSQIVTKGYYCHQWGTRIVAVVQEDLFDQFHSHAAINETKLEQSNIVFMLYQFSRASKHEPWQFGLKRIVPTTHSLVMQSILYETPPVKSLFEAKIISRMKL